MQKRFDENVARVIEAVKERELRASLEKTAKRKGQEIRSEAREELNAAVVQTISESQADLGVRAGAAEPVVRNGCSLARESACAASASRSSFADWTAPRRKSKPARSA